MVDTNGKGGAFGLAEDFGEIEKFHWILQDGATTSYKLVYTPMKTIIISTTNHS